MPRALVLTRHDTRWVHNFLLLGEHIAAHAPRNATGAAPARFGGSWLGLGGRAGSAGGAHLAPRLPRKALRPDASADDDIALGGGTGDGSAAATLPGWSYGDGGLLAVGWKRPAAAALMLSALLVLGERRRRGGALSAAARLRGAPATTRVRDL